MGKLISGFKRLLGNKNTVTIIGVLAGIAVLYVGYNWRVKQAVDPVSVPYAKQRIIANAEVTNDMVGTIKVSQAMIDSSPTLLTSNAQVIGKFVAADTTVAEGSLFYSSMLVPEEEQPNYIIKDIQDGYTVYSLTVNSHLTYANSIIKDSYIDLYFKAVDDNDQIVFCKLIEHIKVIAVKDAAGKNTFSSDSTGIPAELVFAVPDEWFRLLKKADYISTNQIELVPVPRNEKFSEEGNNMVTEVASTDVKDFITSKSSTMIDDDPITETENNQENQNENIEQNN